MALPAGANRNQDYFGCGVAFGPEIPDELRLLLFTPETSGGLLMAAPAERDAGVGDGRGPAAMGHR